MVDRLQVLLWTLVTLTAVMSEVRFVCPRPASPKSDIDTGSCELFGFAREYTDVWPGLLTIQYEEPIVRNGSVMKVELIDLEKRSEPCVLQDQIPHNDRLTTPSDPTLCLVGNYPLGMCGTSSFITVNIPDITCSKCALKLSQILMPSEGAVYCEEENCIKYRSCANIRIRSKTPNTIANCTGLYNEKIRRYWGLYGPVIYQPSKETDPRFQTDYFRFVDNLAENKITYDINIPETDDIEVQNIYLFRHRLARTFMAKLESSFEKPQHFVGTLAKKKYYNFRHAYMKNGPVLRISFTDLIDNKYDFHYTSQLSVMRVNSYALRTMDYSPSGWVRDPRYVGPTAEYTDVVYPAGRCAPPVAQYGVLLVNDTEQPSGVITYLANDLAHITGVLPRASVTWNVTLDSNDTIPSKYIKINTLWANAEIETFPKSFVLNGDDGSTITGEARKALQAIVYHDNQRYGLAIILLVGTNQYRVHYFLKNVKGRIPSPTDVWLAYPTSDDVTHNLTHGIVRMLRMNFMFGGWTTDVTFNGTGDEFFIRSGHYSIHSTKDVDSRYSFSARFEAPGDDFCSNVTHTFCNVIHLKRYNRRDGMGGEVDPYGVMSVTEEASGALTIRMYIRDLQWDEKVDAAYFYTGRPDSTDARQLIDMAFVYPLAESKTATLNTKTILNDELQKLWRDGSLYMAVRLTKGAVLSNQKPVPTTIAPTTSKKSTIPSGKSTDTMPGPTTDTVPGSRKSTTRRPHAPDIVTEVDPRKSTDGVRVPGEKTPKDRSGSSTIETTTDGGMTTVLSNVLSLVCVLLAAARLL